MKKFVTVFFILFVAFIGNPLFASTIHVPLDYELIQTAIDSAENGDTVLVTDGIYNETDLDYFGKSIVVTSENGPEVTIIDCEGSGRGFYFHSGESSTSVLSGFTIRNGSNSGMYCNNSSPTITECIIEDNSGWVGGGIRLEYLASPTISYCTIRNNIATDGQHGNGGGGIFMDHANSPLITHCVISGNTANKGGGICLDYASHLLVENCLIYGNTANVYGGGICCPGSYSSEASITNCTIADNVADQGGGVYAPGLSTEPVYMRNTIIWSNTALTTSYHSIYSVYFEVSFSDIGGGWPGVGNLNVDPNFVDFLNNDFHLRIGAPGVDAGDPYDEYSQEPQPNGARINMGCYGNTAEATIGTADKLNILSVTPASGLPEGGNQVVIRGMNLGSSQGNGIVEFETISAAIVDWSDTLIVCLAPTYHGGFVSLEVRNNDDSFDIRTSGYYYDGPDIWYVPGDTPLIQSAIDWASDSDSIKVAPGTYSGLGNTELDFYGKEIILTSENGPEVTIIDCGGSSRGFYFHSGESVASVLSGFTVTNGNPGIYCGSGSPLIRECIIHDNTRGIYFSSSSARIEDCIIRSNSASDGGGIYCSGGSPTLERCVIDSNTVGTGSGGGIYSSSSLTIEGCTIAHNSSQYGGGIYSSGGSLVIYRTVLTQNAISGNRGGGIYSGSISLTIRNTILWGNTSTNPAYRSIYSLSHEVSYSDIEGSWLGEGNIDENPLFLDLGTSDYHLQAASPCIDAGYWADDYSQEPLPNGDRINMGIYGNTSEATTSSATKPIMTTIVPDNGPPTGGTTVTIDGSHFGAVQGTGSVTFGGIAVVITVWSDTQVVCTTPAHAGGTVVVELVADYSESDRRQDGFDYTGPATLFVPSQYPLIQSAIDWASDSDSIKVAPGTYSGLGNTELDFYGKEIILISENGPEVTIIDCEESGRGFYFHSGEGTTSVLKGFTIKNGSNHGIYCYNSSPMITECIIEDNSGWQGGGIRLEYFASPTISYCTIRNNISTDSQWNSGGGGISMDHANSPLITHCVITGNTANRGGGIGLDYACHLLVENCLIYGNTANQYGGGIFCPNSYSSEASITNCTIADNVANQGGGVYAPGASDEPVYMRNCIIWSNTALTTPDSSIYSVYYEVSYSDVQGAWPGEGNIDENPLFDSDYCLLANSPCIDTADPASPLDPDSTRADMGACSFYQTLLASANTLDYGPIEIGVPTDSTLTLYNNTGAQITLYSIAASHAAFTTDWQLEDSVIAARDSLQLIVTFNPDETRTYYDSLTIVSNAQNAETLFVWLTGEGGVIPLPIADLAIAIDAEKSAVLNWSPVTETINGNPFTPDYYLVFASSVDPYADSLFIYLAVAQDTTYTHFRAGMHADKMFYCVVSYRGSSPSLFLREGVSTLLDLPRSKRNRARRLSVAQQEK